MSAGTVLIIDDSLESRSLLSEVLAAEGYDVRPADSGALALASIALHPPEVILLDMRMPGMDGMEVCRRLKARPESRDIPVIFLSATRNFEQRLEGLESGAVDFVSKPFQRQELLARLKTHLELSRLRKNLERRVSERTAELQEANERLENELIRRQQMEAELRESEQRFRSIADSAPGIIFMSDPAGNVTYVSQWGLNFTGWSTEEFSGQAYLDLIHPEDRPRVLETFTAAVGEQKSYQVEYRNRRADGEYRWLAETGNPRILNGKFAGHVAVALDLTELKGAQQQAMANQKLESLGVLTAGIAHTFNNLVSTMVAYADLALDEIGDDSPAHESVAAISTVALRASEIVSLLIAYTGRIDSDTAEPVDLSALLQGMVQLLTASIPPATSLRLELSKDTTRIWANAGQIRQVVLNLIVNASESLQAQPGTVTVATSRVSLRPDSTELRPSGLRDGQYVLFEVSDTGCGMTDEVKGNMFDPFFSTKSLGRGLGLPSVHGIVRDAGGAIAVVSDPGRGSKFQVWFPLWNGVAHHGLTAAGGLLAHAGTVLLADDDEVARFAAAAALQREGFSVMATHDGLAAVDLFERYSREIGAVVLNATLSGISGLDVCAEIRALKPDVRVLFTDAGGGMEQDIPIQEHVLPKPYQTEKLIDALRELMTAN